MPIPINVMFLFPGRTGSSYILTLVAQHPQAFIRGELCAEVMFEISNKPWDERLEYLNLNYRWPEDPYFVLRHDKFLDLSDLLFQYYSQSFGRDIRVCGLKSKIADLPCPPLFESLAWALRLQVVRLSRRNPVKWAISWIRAYQLAERHRRDTGEAKWNITSDQERLPATEVDCAWLLRLLQDYQNEKWEFRRVTAGTKVISEWFYEDFLENRDLFMKQLTASLGLEPWVYNYDQAPQRKNTSDILWESVSNYDTICSHLRGTEFECFL